MIDVDALGGELQTTPLFWAAYHNHIYAVELLLRNGASAHFMDRAGFNPFLLSIQVPPFVLSLPYDTRSLLRVL